MEHPYVGHVHPGTSTIRIVQLYTQAGTDRASTRLTVSHSFKGSNAIGTYYYVDLSTTRRIRILQYLRVTPLGVQLCVHTTTPRYLKLVSPRTAAILYHYEILNYLLVDLVRFSFDNGYGSPKSS